jgi:hypothetical protein
MACSSQSAQWRLFQREGFSADSLSQIHLLEESLPLNTFLKATYSSVSIMLPSSLKTPSTHSQVPPQSHPPPPQTSRKIHAPCQTSLPSRLPRAIPPPLRPSPAMGRIPPHPPYPPPPPHRLQLLPPLLPRRLPSPSLRPDHRQALRRCCRRARRNGRSHRRHPPPPSNPPRHHFGLHPLVFVRRHVPHGPGPRFFQPPP